MKFLLGLAMGFAIGMLYAPVPGEEMRERLYDKMGEYAEVPERKIADMAQEKKEKAGEMGARLGRKAAESAVDAVSNKLTDKEKTA